MSALITLLDQLPPTTRRDWALTVAHRAVGRLPATALRRAVLEDALQTAYPADAPAAPPTVHASLCSTLLTLSDRDSVGLAYYATLTVTWLLHGPIHTPTATLVGASAVWAAIAGAAPGAGQAAGPAERGMQVAQARAALDGPADPHTIAGIWDGVGEGRS